MARQLNTTQITTLTLALQFRYLTTDNLAQHRSITTNSAYSSLQILQKTGYLGKIHHKSYRLLNKSARYCLTRQGIDYLRKEIKLPLHDAQWLSRKSDSKKLPDFIDLQVALHMTYNDLRARLGSDSKIMTALETHSIPGIIKPLPGLLVELKSGKRFFVEIVDGQHLFLIKKRIRKYIQHYEDGEWGWGTYPDVYFVRSMSASDRTRLRQYIEEQMDNTYLDVDDFSFHVVSKIDQIKLK